MTRTSMIYHLILLPFASDYCTRSSKRLKSILRWVSRNDPPYYLRTNTYSTSKGSIVRVLIKNGLQRSYTLKETAKKMGYKTVGLVFLIHAVFGGVTPQREDHLCHDVHASSLTSVYSCKIDVFDQIVIGGPVARLKSSAWMGKLKESGSQLSDVGVGQRG
jgi:hypothetical protein